MYENMKRLEEQASPGPWAGDEGSYVSGPRFVAALLEDDVENGMARIMAVFPPHGKAAADAKLAANAPTYSRLLRQAGTALAGRCWHHDLYEERDDGAGGADYPPNIMHKEDCANAAECTDACRPCAVLADIDKLEAAL